MTATLTPHVRVLLLDRTDWLSTAVGLEVRMPFTDQEDPSRPVSSRQLYVPRGNEHK